MQSSGNLPEASALTETDVRSQRIASGSEAGPKRCSDAIERGLAQFAEGRYEDAIDMFTHSLELPGKGFVRSAGAARALAHACESASPSLCRVTPAVPRLICDVLAARRMSMRI